MKIFKFANFHWKFSNQVLLKLTNFFSFFLFNYAKRFLYPFCSLSFSWPDGRVGKAFAFKQKVSGSIPAPVDQFLFSGKNFLFVLLKDSNWFRYWQDCLISNFKISKSFNSINSNEFKCSQIAKIVFFYQFFQFF